MKAIIQTRYGAPDVLTLAEADRPTTGDHDVLVQVAASPVTQGDRRLRAADFPGIAWLPGRMMMGLLRPKNRVPGTVFAGTVAAVGASVTRFAPGDTVFGMCSAGAQAEYVAVAEDGVIARVPACLDLAEAAALPYGALSALTFLRDLGQVQPGQQVLVVGAAGGVGRYAVQLARHLGATVTGVCSTADVALVRGLGAHHVIDYRDEDFTDRAGRGYDVILDTSGTARFRTSRRVLTPTGRFLSLEMSAGLFAHMAWTALRGGQRAIFGISQPTAADLETIGALVDAGALSPTLDSTFPLALTAEAHARVERHRPRGEVVVTVAPPVAALRAAA